MQIRRPGAQGGLPDECPATHTCSSPELHGLQAWRREEGRFRRDYNDKLLNGLVVFALADILLFRFVVRISLAETAGWIGFVFLQACCGKT